MKSLWTLAAAALTLALGASHASAQWGTVKGRITWGGALPYAPDKVKVDKDQAHCLAKGEIAAEKYVVGKSGGVKDVFVWLTDAGDKAKLPIHPSLKEPKEKEVVMDQPCCKFEPHALALREGQTLVGKNSSPIAHNMNWTGGNDNPGNNKLIPAGGEIKIDDLVASPSVVSVSCNIHPWMKAWVRVFNHPYYAVTDADGKFEIKNAPAGKYNVVIWQDMGWVNGGRTGQTITIPDGGTVEVNEKVKPSE